MYQTFRATASIIPPLAYVIPVQWDHVIDVIKAHGLRTSTISSAEAIEVESYRFANVQWAHAPFEGRFMPTVDTERLIETRTFPAGSVLVPMGQPLAKVGINLLEPKAPDSLVHWGFFNAIFEEKEYGEHYVLEALAREMLVNDPHLRDEFHQRLAMDHEFASSPAERLRFFYKRSPYWDPQMNLYPVGRIVRANALL